MKYDFDKLTDRFDSQSYKWDVGKNELPMWVADMDFETAPEIREALEKRVRHGIFGYNIVPDEWYEAYINWWKKRHNTVFNKDWFLFCTGVVPAISSMVRKLTCVGENVLIQTPVYNIFFNSILNNGRNVVESPLVYENGEYHVDFEDLEKKLGNYVERLTKYVDNEMNSFAEDLIDVIQTIDTASQNNAIEKWLETYKDTSKEYLKNTFRKYYRNH